MSWKMKSLKNWTRNYSNSKTTMYPKNSTRRNCRCRMTTPTNCWSYR